MTVEKTTLQEYVSLKPYNTFGIDINTRYFTEIHDIEELKILLHDPAWQHVDKLILGGGSNLLFTRDYAGLVIKMAIPGIKKIDENAHHVWLKIGSGVNWHQFVMYCVVHQYGGVENFSLIPGTVGAAPMQNIGAYGAELKDVFYELEALHLQDGSLYRFNNQSCKFDYRSSIFKTSHRNQYVIYSVTLKLNKKHEFNIDYGAIKETLKQMGVKKLSIKAVSDAVIHIRQSKLPDPEHIGNAGSFFKNPEVPSEHYLQLQAQHPQIPHFQTAPDRYKIPAAWLIEQCGWKGKRIGNIGVHDRQALVLVNHGNGSGQAIHELALQIQQSVYDTFAIQLIPEVKVVG